MKIAVIDGQGGGLGRNIIARIKKEFDNVEIIGIGTNSIATSSMIKAGADYGATGENAIAYNCKKADVIVGALGIGFANSMHGEISPQAAGAVSESDAYKILIPISKCNVCVTGVVDKSMSEYIEDLIIRLKEIIK